MAKTANVSTNDLKIFFDQVGSDVKKANPNSIQDGQFLHDVLSGEQNLSGRNGVVTFDPGYNPNTPGGGTGKSSVYGFNQMTLGNARALSRSVLGVGPTNVDDPSYDEQLKVALADPKTALKFSAEYLKREENTAVAALKGVDYSKTDLKAVVAGSYNLGSVKNAQAIKAATIGGKFDREAYYQAYYDALNGVDKNTNNVNRVRRAAGDLPATEQYSSRPGEKPNSSQNKTTYLQADEDAHVTSDQSYLQSDYTTVQSDLPSLVIETGIDENPWFKDRDLTVGNPKLQRAITPCWFEVNLKQEGNSRLTDSNGNPLLVRLNVSLAELTDSEAHVINTTHSRTGFHITVWGQEPDVITASGTTGVFMNWFGVTSVMSKSGSLDRNDLDDLVQDNFAANKGALLEILNANSKLRVAAQDAFVEILGLFKNNGVTRFHPEITKRVFAGKDSAGKMMVGEASWSPALGASFTQSTNKNNEVLSRGYVVFRYKNRSYLGYFKTIEFTMDANNPFKWDFSFTFQVEKTLRVAYVDPFGD